MGKDIRYSDLNAEQRDLLAMHVAINSQLTADDASPYHSNTRRTDHGALNAAILKEIDLGSMTPREAKDLQARLAKHTSVDSPLYDILPTSDTSNAKIAGRVEELVALPPEQFKAEAQRTLDASIRHEIESKRVGHIAGNVFSSALSAYTAGNSSALQIAAGIVVKEATGRQEGKSAEEKIPILGPLFRKDTTTPLYFQEADASDLSSLTAPQPRGKCAKDPGLCRD